MEKLFEAMDKYFEKFGERFGMMFFMGDTVEDTITRINHCLEIGKPMREVYKIRDDVLY